jgi:broad specificity phosphatase PhoE
MTVNNAFIEIDYGDLDGQPLSVISAAQWRAFQLDHEVAFGGGESLAMVDRRVHEALNGLLEDETSLLHSAHEHLAIVSHVSPIKSAAVWALGVAGSATWRMRISNGSMTTIATRRGEPYLENFNVVPVPQT